MESSIASAPGKVILTGEHSVVYGYPAIAVALGLRCKVKASYQDEGLTIRSKDLNLIHTYSLNDLQHIEQKLTVFKKFDNIAFGAFLAMNKKPVGINLEIESEIPISSGLGSSAAVSVAAIKSISNLFEQNLIDKEISDLAYQSEIIAHGTPSGIDNSIATYGGLLKFEKGNITLNKLNFTIPLIIGNTQVQRDTKKIVKNVKDQFDHFPKIIDPILKTMGELTENAENALISGDFKKLGELLDINHGLLSSLGTSHPKLDDLIWKMRSMNVLGAKLTGAGGGGCMIAIAENINTANTISKKLNEEGYNIIVTNLSPEGVKIESN